MGKNKKRKLSTSQNDDHGGTPDAVNVDSDGDALVNSKCNPLYKEQQLFLSKLTFKERNFYFSSSAITPDRRAELWMEQADIGEGLVNQYAWATPTNECLQIFREFSPIVEIGSGSNAYWANYIKKQLAQDIDIVAYDMNVNQGGKIPSEASNEKKQKKKAKHSSGDQKDTVTVQKGGPEVLRRREFRNHTLFLCYPDEEDAPILTGDDDDDEQDSTSPPPLSFGWQCLNEYKGKFVIHVGELALLGDATLNMEQSPWGRSSSPEFQQRLASEFHCIAKIPLPNWLHVRDSISVWKRSEICQMTFVGDEDDEDDEEEVIEYRHVPPEEMLPQRVIAPCLEHIFAPSLPANNATPTGKSRPNEMESNGKKTDPEHVAAGKDLSTSTSTKAKTDEENEIGTDMQTKKTKRGKRRERQKQKKKILLQSSSSPNDCDDDDDQSKKKMEKKARSEYFKLHGRLPPQS